MEFAMLRSRLVIQIVALVVYASLSMSTLLAELPRLPKVLTYQGYPNCIQLENDTIRVVLCPAAGGRVLEYSFRGRNALYLEEEQNGKPYELGQRAAMTAGRFDIGPEKMIPRHATLWSGKWAGEVVGPRGARLTSAKDEATGTQLVREFHIDKTGSRLVCKQIMRNVSARVTEWCHWSRTFALGNGICVIPLTTPSRFPNGYVMYEDGDLISFRPTDPHIRARDGFLEITGVPRKPKLGMDSAAGWFAYLMRTDIMFVKRFRVYPDRVYNEIAGLTISIWYPEDRRVELEPIGPRERLQPGESAAFTEEWFLLPYKFPADGQDVDLESVEKLVKNAFAVPGLRAE
jgi:hypothetical protein